MCENVFFAAVSIVSTFKHFTPLRHVFLHCTINNLNLRIKTEPVTGADAMIHVRQPSHIPLILLQPWQARFLCRDWDYFWDSVVQDYTWFPVAYSSSPCSRIGLRFSPPPPPVRSGVGFQLQRKSPLITPAGLLSLVVLTENGIFPRLSSLRKRALDQLIYRYCTLL